MKYPKDMRAGSIFHTKSGDISVVEYISHKNVVVKFKSTGYQKSAESTHIRSGSVRDPTMPSVYGVGFLGDGGYKSKYNSKNTKAYDSWHHMMTRCYDESYKARKPTYSECTVCEDWHNFQNFAKWHEENYPKDCGIYCLDKDLKVIGNKLYSPEMCMYVSNGVNAFITDSGKSRGILPIGVTMTKYGKFISRCSSPITNTSDYLGTFNSENLAHLAWRKRKSKIAELLIQASIREDEKLGLANYKYALDNFKIHA